EHPVRPLQNDPAVPLDGPGLERGLRQAAVTDPRLPVRGEEPLAEHPGGADDVGLNEMPVIAREHLLENGGALEEQAPRGAHADGDEVPVAIHALAEKPDDVALDLPDVAQRERA